MRKRTRTALIGSATAVAIATALTATVAVSAPSAKTTATCTSSPAITPAATSDSFRVTCSVPKQPTATVTVTQTVTATPTSTSSSPTSTTPISTTTNPTTTVPTTTAPTTPASGFPNAASTGPRIAVTAGSGNVCGTVSGRLITGDLILGCDSTVTDSRIMGRVVSNGYRLTGSYLEIGPDSCPANSTTDFQAIRGSVTLDHTHLHNNPGQDPVALLGTTTIRDSLIDRTCFYAGDHLDGAQLYDPGAKTVAVLDHNTIDARAANSTEKGNAAVFLADTPGRGTSITVTNSLLAGGNFTTSAYDAYAGSGVVYDFRDNTYVKGSAVYGACSSNSAAYDGTSGLRFTGNRYDDGSPLSSC